MAVGNCSEIGENLSKIANRLLKNDDLVKLLYYSNANPLTGDNLTQEEKTNLIFNQLIKIIPIVKPVNDKSIISIQITSGTINSNNDEFRDLKLQINFNTCSYNNKIAKRISHKKNFKFVFICNTTGFFIRFLETNNHL